ncbi:DUF4916 domain-containing protein [Actinotignum urinale]|uniref:DUF4916 domain-containing protein n=1 Tax=Actinotignum urinale TaxID=190146 RepID=UPI0003B3A9D5|nr:DUF4916 domain-containing protein [Actinotignum urinale]MDY5129638.1 DUF4916 domain-containing protein [Actinotignum urinale]MDY5159986.1 DUF4916 domain-containing protein [Actinotignum urinale]
MSEIDSADMGPWLNPEQLEFVRRKVPMIYVDIVPVRIDETGRLQAIGMLLSADSEGITREFPSGRILFHEPIRDAMMRHIDKELGLMAIAQLPANLTPFTVEEYFPTLEPDAGYYDPRQHRVDLGYIVPIQGEANPGTDALEFSWFTPGEARTPELQAELTPGHAVLLRKALAHLGELR